MNTTNELNNKLRRQSFLGGYVPTKEDADTFAEMFGRNTAAVQWAARMASYYAADREWLATGREPSTPSANRAQSRIGERWGAKRSSTAVSIDPAMLGAADVKESKIQEVPAEGEHHSSTVVLDVNVWDDSVDLKALGAKLFAVVREGLVWEGQSAVPAEKRLQLRVRIDEEKILSEDLEDVVLGMEDEVKSMEIVSWTALSS